MYNLLPTDTYVEHELVYCAQQVDQELVSIGDTSHIYVFSWISDVADLAQRRTTEELTRSYNPGSTVDIEEVHVWDYEWDLVFLGVARWIYMNQMQSSLSCLSEENKCNVGSSMIS